LRVLAAWHLDEEVRRLSSSGGVFTALAERILANGGVVVGAAFDSALAVHHVVVQNAAELHRLRGSKYVQSEIKPGLYAEMRALLREGRAVLFCGTPCQVAGVRSYLGNTFDNLYCCDLVCHGTPSPLLWERYLRHQEAAGGGIAAASFRDKERGWKNFGMRHYLRNGTERLRGMFEDPYLIAFLRNYALRPVCYDCRYASTKRTGDVSLADFWGVAAAYPQYDADDKGTSLVLVNTAKGEGLLESCGASLFVGEADLDSAVAGNHVLQHPTPRPEERDRFYVDLERCGFDGVLRMYRLRPPLFLRRVVRAIKRSLSCRK